MDWRLAPELSCCYSDSAQRYAVERPLHATLAGQEITAPQEKRNRGRADYQGIGLPQGIVRSVMLWLGSGA